MGVAELLQKRKAALALKNQEDGDAYRLSYQLHQNTIKLDSGIIYEILEQGSGIKPLVTDRILCHYHGTTVSGEVFDSSVLRNQPATFSLVKLIKAWQQVIPLIDVGTKFRMVVPPEMAYRDQQLTKEIGPNSTLIFEITLLDIVL